MALVHGVSQIVRACGCVHHSPLAAHTGDSTANYSGLDNSLGSMRIRGVLVSVLAAESSVRR